VLSPVAVEKLPHQKNDRKNFALGSLTNDFLSFLRHFLCPRFFAVSRKGLFQWHLPAWGNESSVFAICSPMIDTLVRPAIMC
jgi:hypothetical protein